MEKVNRRKNYRRCISCREVREKKDFLRVVRTYPESQITINEGMGRSAYICPQADCIKIAKKQKKLSRALKTQISQQIYEELWQELSDMDDEK